MIQAKDLRVGNFIQSNGLHKGKIVVVDQILCKYNYEPDRVLFFKDYNSGDYAKDCEPLPLTEEWLLKFGFEFDEITWYNSKFTKFFMSQGNGGFDYWINRFADPIVGNIKSVHQLQNIFHALTGEELTIKE